MSLDACVCIKDIWNVTTLNTGECDNKQTYDNYTHTYDKTRYGLTVWGC